MVNVGPIKGESSLQTPRIRFRKEPRTFERDGFDFDKGRLEVLLGLDKNFKQLMISSPSEGGPSKPEIFPTLKRTCF